MADWWKLRVNRDDCSVVKHRMQRYGLPLCGGPGSVADMAICCASVLRAARRAELAVSAGDVISAWMRWRGLDSDHAQRVKRELMEAYSGDIAVPYADGVIDILGVLF